MSQPIRDRETTFLLDNIFRQRHPRRELKSHLEDPELKILRKALSEYRLRPEDRVENLSTARGYLSEVVMIICWNDFAEKNALNITARRADFAAESRIELLNGKKPADSQNGFLRPEYKSIDIYLWEYGGPELGVDTTLLTRATKRQLDPKNESNEVDPSTFPVYRDNLLIGRFLDQLLSDIWESLPTLDEDKNITEGGRLPWEVVNTAGYLYSRLARIYESLTWTPDYVTPHAIKK